MLLLSHIPPEKFRSILERIRGAVYTTEIPQYENIHPTVSIGGVYQAHPLVEAIRRADQMLADYDGVLYRLKIRSGELAQEARENERLLLKLLEESKR